MMGHRLSSICALADGQLADLPDRLLVQLEARCPVGGGAQGQEGAVAWHVPGVGLGQGRDECLDVASPSAVASLAASSPGNAYGVQLWLRARCAAGSLDSRLRLPLPGRHRPDAGPALPRYSPVDASTPCSRLLPPTRLPERDR